MLKLIKNVMLLSVYHAAKGTVETIEKEMKKEDKDEAGLKRKMLVVGMVHQLLGTLYND